MHIFMTISLKKIIITGMILTCLVLILSLLSGSAISFDRLFFGHLNESSQLILWKIRLPRFLAAYFVGASLAISGLILQSALNNALASPSVIGINSGAGFFTLVAAFFFPYFMEGRMLMSFLGALVSAMIVYGISSKASLSKTTLILAGLAVNSFMSGLVNAMITFFPETVGDKVAFNLGGFSTVILSQLDFAIPLIIVTTMFVFRLSKGMDILLLGDEMAQSLGVNVRRLRFLLIFFTALLSGLSVSICGLISFVGLIVPHIVRRLIKGDSRMHIAACGLYGGCFLVLCDLLAKSLFAPYELPVGLLMSLIGAPFFIYLLIHKKRRLSL